MNKKATLSILVFVLGLWFSFGCGMQSSRKPQPLVIPGGTVAPALGVGFDVNYDSSLDGVIPGYKVLTVAYTNNSMNIIQTDPTNDKWYVIDRAGKKRLAVTNLRVKDPDAWSGLPRKLKMLLEYPLLIPIGGTKTIDLLFPIKVNLGEYRAILYQSAMGQAYKVVPRED